ncbi:xin actin-binding repeat-containing protein 2 [Chiloscyllium plagiosum]|uniref:xin actin-binding repeat-containing protein 2 n=1 Tax=Chiloscyllium plagiosum TaxID=36176 RepID=UPI001CB7B01F|nr:xin actin-binding repeat-containing protein 2 [Chiloscyllium plagiosum]
MEIESETRMLEETQRKNISISPKSAQEIESTQNEVVKEDLQAARRIEKFAIPLDDLKMLFERSDTPKSKKELRGGRSLSSASKQQSPNPSDSFLSNLDCKVTGELEETMSLDSKETNTNEAALTSDEPSQADIVPLDFEETVSLKDRLAMYQAAVSKKTSNRASAVDPAEEARALPGGLSSVKKQFESHSTVAHYQQQSVQDVTSTSKVKVNSSTRKTDQEDDLPSTTEQLLTYKMETASVMEQNTHLSSKVGNFENYFNDFSVDGVTEDEKPKISTQMLKEQFEKTAQPTQMATNTTKKIKTEHNFQEMQWPPALSTSNISTTAGKNSEVTSLRKVDSTAASVSISSSNCENMEEFPPPPPDLLNAPSEITYFLQSPEPPLSATKQIIPKDVYSKQRNLYELKRLYKHINPGVRKNLEKEFNQEISEIVTNKSKDNDIMGDVQQAKYVFEYTGHSPQKCMSPEREYLEWDEILKGEVQSMRWMFETQPLDSIKDETPDQSDAKCLSQQEMIAGGDVKYTTWMFETQAIDTLGVSSPESPENTGKIPELARGDVRTATWLFETQPLDSMNKIHQEDEQAIEISTAKDITAGDVKTARYLFETQSLDTLGHLDSVDEMNLLHLKTEVEEIKGNVKKTTKLFETQPLYVIRDQSGQVLEIQTVKREEIERGDVKTALWLFETKPLDTIHKDVSSIKVVCGISREEVNDGGVNRAKWLFETHPLDSIKEQLETDTSVKLKEEIQGADVSRQCWMFETQPFDSLKDNDNARPIETEEIIGGDVRSTKHLFETVPMDTLKGSPDIGKVKHVIATEEEKGDVRHQTWIFETQPLEMIGEDKEEYTKTIHLEEINKGDVSNYKQLFETMNLSHIDESKKIQVDGVISGAVLSNRTLFETTPLYAVQDSAGHYHEVKTVRREEIVRGDVRTCRWMFETTPIDQFDESLQKFQIIRGISKEEIQSGDVKTAKWLFETQPFDAIKYFSNVEDEEVVTKQHDDIRGDVQTCRWLFETQPMDALYEKVDIKNQVDEIQKGDVKTCTWLFETQPLDAIKDDSETVLTMRTVQQEDIQGSDVQMARFLFETESLGNIGGEKEEFRRVTKIDIQSGDVSRKKWIFENKSLDLINSSSEEMLKNIRFTTANDIQKGNVINCTWLFENHPIDAIKENIEERAILRTITDVQGGDVDKGRLIFETFSLDQIKDNSSENTELKKVSMEQIEKGDVKNYTMLFETQPLYAIKDKEGCYHEVTTVRKEEVISGDVRGTRWLFETKPLDLIKETDEVYVIKAVTQEDIQKGDVSSARWRFETQPLDKIADHEKVIAKTVSDVQGGDVKSNAQLFESDLDQKYVRTVSVSEIQHGNVRTATWLFESHTIDEIKGEDSEYERIETVGREDIQKGDVKQAIWLFEKQPLNSIKENDDTNMKILEEIPQVDVKTTTWLFETTPLHQFTENPVERPEIVGKNIKETLKSLYDCKLVQSQGILIEADEVGDIRMAKYQLLNQTSPEIQKEQIVRGDLQKIMMELLSKKESTEKGITIDTNEKGNINLTRAQLFKKPINTNIEKEDVIGCDIQQVITNLFNYDSSAKKGILIQESEKGNVKMTIYSLLNRTDDMKIQQDEVIKGDIQAALHKLIATSQNSENSQKVKVTDTEKGNVQFYTTCIESGAMDYLKLLQQETDETAVAEQTSKEVIHGDVEGAKQKLKHQQMPIPPPISPITPKVQEMITAGHPSPYPSQSDLNLIPPYLHQSPSQQRKPFNKAPKLQPSLKMPNTEYSKAKEQPKKNLVSKPNITMTEDALLSKQDIQQQKYQPAQEKQHEPHEHSTCPQIIQSPLHQSVIQPAQNPTQKKQALAPPLNKVFLPLEPSIKTDTTKPQPKPYTRKFKTPLMIAEEKYRKEREEMEKSKAAKMAWPINMGRLTTGALKSPTKVESENSLTVKSPVLPNIMSVVDRLTSPTSQAMEKENMTTVDKYPIYPKTSETMTAKDLITANTLSSHSPAQSAVVAASEQLHNILKYSNNAISHKEEIFNAFKDSVKDIGLETIKQDNGIHKKTQEQSSHLKPHSATSSKLKVETVQPPKESQVIQEQKKNALSYKKEQNQILKPEANKSQEKTVIKQFHVKKNNYVDMAKQEQHHIFVQQYNRMGEHYQPTTEEKDKKIEETTIAQTFATNVAQDQVKDKVIQHYKQQSHRANLKETQQVQQKKDKRELSQEIKSEKMQKHHVMAQKEAFPKFQGEQDQQKSDLVGINQKPLDKQAHMKKHHDWKEMQISKNLTEQKADQGSFQATEHQSSYLQNANSKQGLVPARMEDIKQENKESRKSRNTAIYKKEIDKNDAGHYVEISDSYKKREELQNILFQLIQFEKENDNIDLNAIQAFLEKVPKWLTDGQGFPMKVIKGSNLQILKKELTQIKQKALLRLAYFDESMQKTLISMPALKPEKETFSGSAPSQKISKISIGSCKLDKQGKSNAEEQVCESRKQQLSEIGLAEQRAQSPAKRMSSPSPSYITIESTARRTESPLRAVASPPLSQKQYSTPYPVQQEPTPTSPLPMRSSEMKTSRIRTSSTSSASPPRGKRYDQLAKLKDTTAKLSQGISQSAQSTHVQVAEKRSEIIPSPATLRRQLKIDTPVTDMLAKHESPVSSITVKDMTEMFEEARRSEENKVYMRKDPIDIPERLGSDTEESESIVSKQNVQMPKIDLSELVNKFEVPEQINYFQKEPAERLGTDSGNNLFGTKTAFEEILTFDMKSVKPQVESSGQITIPIKHEHPQGDGKVLQKSQISQKVKEGVKASTQSMLCPDADNKQFAHAGGFETEAIDSRTRIQHSEIFSGIDSRHAPPTYEDVISGQILDISADNTPEELLKNFQKTWQESERVFRSLGYEISDTNESRWQEDVLHEDMVLTENTRSYQGDLHSLSKDSISHGKSGSRQANLS